MNKIIKIQSVNPNVLRINLTVTTHCPYSCRYCPESLHNGKHNLIDLDKFKKFLLRFSDRLTIVNLSGGECTTHPQFKELMQVIHDVGFKSIVDTNTVRTLRFYEEVSGLVDNWCVSLHPSQHTLDLDKLKLLASTSFLVVYVMMDPEHWEKSIDWFTQVSGLADLKATPARIIDNWGGSDYKSTYTTEQLATLQSLDSSWGFTSERENTLRKTHMWLHENSSTVFFDDGTNSELDAFEVIRNKQNNFFGFTCSAGYESICIYADGSATWANCGVKRFDDYADIDIEQTFICPFNECTCATDVRSTKSL